MKRLGIALIAAAALVLAGRPASAANLVVAADGNFTSSATWGTAEAGSGAAITTLSALQTITTSYVYSTAFTCTNGSVVDAVMVSLQRANSTGTFSLALSEDNGVTATREVTVNVTDLNAGADESWVTFKFGSTLTCDGGSDYRVGLKTSSASQVSGYRDATGNNWSRLLRTTTGATPAAGDNMYIAGEWTAAATWSTRTVTMNETATTQYGLMSIGDRGTLTYGTSAATNYVLRLNGDLVIYTGGTFQMGTTGTPIPRDSTAVLEFQNSADAGNGIDVLLGGTFIAQGQSRSSGKNVIQTLLDADEAAGQTVLSVADDTGWKSGDEIALASTTLTTTVETRTLASDAGASDLTVTAGLTAARGGSGLVRAEVILLTHNVKIRSVSSTNMSYFSVWSTATLDLDWVELQYMGSFSWPGLYIAGTGSVDVRYVTIRNGEGEAITMASPAAAPSFQDVVIYNVATANNRYGVNLASATGAYTFRNVTGMAMGGNFGGMLISDAGGTLENIRSVSNGGGGLWVADASGVAWEIDGVQVHSNGTSGFVITGNYVGNGTVRNFKFWRNNCSSCFNLQFGGFEMYAITFEDGYIFGEAFSALGNVGMRPATGPARDFVFRNVAIAGDSGSGVSSDAGVYLDGNGGIASADNWLFENCTFSSGSAPLTTQTYDIRTVNGGLITATLRNTTLAGTNEVNLDSWALGQYVRSEHTDQGARQDTWVRYYVPTSPYPTGYLSRETTTVDVSPALKMTPDTAAAKLRSNANERGVGLLVPVSSGNTATITVKVQKDGSYNGNAPRLIVRENHQAGITTDTVLDTMSGGSGSWETLSGTTAAVAADAVLEFVVDCDGTAGNVFVDTWTADGDAVDDSAWRDGLPLLTVGGAGGGGEGGGGAFTFVR